MEPQTSNSETLWTAEKVAEYLQVSVGTVKQWVKYGKIPMTKVGRLNRFRKEDIDAWLAESSRSAAPAQATS